MPTGLEPPVVAQSTRPRTASASRSPAAIATAAACDAAAWSSSTRIVGSPSDSPFGMLHSGVIGPPGSSVDQLRGHREDVAGDCVAAGGVDRLGEELRLALPCRE